ncbi:hypothetical protein [Amycolatopsis sp. cmx-11-51]|uniref:hypothetical protein n=1 Tax=Amycolatopsis sp. cmx-11-51 TaxID=2785797 RepID=UPI0039E35A5F
MSETEVSVLPEPPQELWRAGKLELAHGVTHALEVMRAASAVLGTYVAEIESSGVNDLYGYGSTWSWLADTARISRGDAEKIVNRTLVLNPTRALDGTEIRPSHPPPRRRLRRACSGTPRWIRSSRS